MGGALEEEEALGSGSLDGGGGCVMGSVEGVGTVPWGGNVFGVTVGGGMVCNVYGFLSNPEYTIEEISSKRPSL